MGSQAPRSSCVLASCSPVSPPTSPPTRLFSFFRLLHTRISTPALYLLAHLLGLMILGLKWSADSSEVTLIVSLRLSKLLELVSFWCLQPTWSQQCQHMSYGNHQSRS